MPRFVSRVPFIYFNILTIWTDLAVKIKCNNGIRFLTRTVLDKIDHFSPGGGRGEVAYIMFLLTESGSSGSTGFDGGVAFSFTV